MVDNNALRNAKPPAAPREWKRHVDLRGHDIREAVQGQRRVVREHAHAVRPKPDDSEVLPVSRREVHEPVNAATIPGDSPRLHVLEESMERVAGGSGLPSREVPILSTRGLVEMVPVGLGSGFRRHLLRLNRLARGPAADQGSAPPTARILCYAETVKQNLTLTVDEELLRDARKVALDRKTSVNQLVREYLEQLVSERSRQQSARKWIGELFEKSSIVVGKRAWNRDDLHER